MKVFADNAFADNGNKCKDECCNNGGSEDTVFHDVTEPEYYKIEGHIDDQGYACIGE